MVKYMMAFVLTFGLLIVGFSTPASATATCVPECDVCQVCVFVSDDYSETECV